MSENANSNKIAFYRKRNVGNQKALGDTLGRSQQQISQWEKGETPPRADEIKNMLRLFGNVTFDEVFETGRLSIHIGGNNDSLLSVYLEQLDDIFPKHLTEFERKSIIVNHILRVFLEDKIPELKESLLDELKKNI